MNLPRGKDRAVPIGLLAESYGLSRRRVERDLEELVLAGLPIVSCPAGVYVADSAEEVERYAAQLEARIGSQLRRIRALRRWAAEQREPLTLWAAA